MLAVEDLGEAADRLGERDILALGAGEYFGDVERLREEALDLARAIHERLVFVGKLFDAENRDDVLEILVALQDPLDFVGHAIVLLADDVRRKRGRAGFKRVDRRIDAERRKLRERA